MRTPTPLKNQNDVVAVPIDLTDEYIENGISYNCSECPLALALNDVVLPIYEVSASLGYTTIFSKGYQKLPNTEWAKAQVWSGDTPESACRFMWHFDRRMNLEGVSRHHLYVMPREVLREGVKYKEYVEPR